jgi:hypothetical protein
MKKLLLVMLVPVMVLGMMGCGSSLETGNEIPFGMHGTWIPLFNVGGTPSYVLEAPYFIITANEMTVIIPNLVIGSTQLAFRAEWSGPNEVPEDGDEFTLAITRILDGVEWGTFKFNVLDANSLGEVFALYLEETIDIDGSVVPYYEFNDLLRETTYIKQILEEE